MRRNFSFVISFVVRSLLVLSKVRLFPKECVAHTNIFCCYVALQQSGVMLADSEVLVVHSFTLLPRCLFGASALVYQKFLFLDVKSDNVHSTYRSAWVRLGQCFVSPTPTFHAERWPLAYLYDWGWIAFVKTLPLEWKGYRVENATIVSRERYVI